MYYFHQKDYLRGHSLSAIIVIIWDDEHVQSNKLANMNGLFNMQISSKSFVRFRFARRALQAYKEKRIKSILGHKKLQTFVQGASL